MMKVSPAYIPTMGSSGRLFTHHSGHQYCSRGSNMSDSLLWPQVGSCALSRANRQFKAAVRLYVSFWCFSCLRTWKQTLVFTFSTSRFFGSPLKVRSWKLIVLTCAGPWVCIWKHLLSPLCNPVTGPLCSILGQRPWQRRALLPVTL